MKADTTFLRLVHVSDLHFGDSLSTPFWVLSTLIPGWETHSERTLKALSELIRLKRGEGSVPLSIVATGDLTTWGRNAAFSLAFTYLRSRIALSSKIWLGFDAPDTPVIPGNYDIWSGLFPGLSSLQTTRPDLDQFFNPPAPKADYPASGASFPYRLHLSSGPPAIYLYGLDSTRIDKLSYPSSQSFLANGFVDEQQLIALNELRAGESEEPAIRIAAIHHPLAYQPPDALPNFKALQHINDVIHMLQSLDFSLALCGHQHKGFIRQIQSGGSPFYVLSVGATAKEPRFSRQEKQILSRPYASLTTSEEKQQRERVSAQCNECRIYDFATALPDSNQVVVTAHTYRYKPNVFAFEHRAPQNLTIHAT